MAYGNTAKDGTGNPWHLLVDADGRLLTREDWTPSLQAEEVANDSDKSFTVPGTTHWRVKWIWVELISTATVGDRVMSVEIQDDAADVIMRVDAGAVQAASLTRYYIFAPWNADLTAFRGASSDLLMTPIPPDVVLPVSYVVRVYDSAAIDAAADDLVIQMMVESRTVT